MSVFAGTNLTIPLTSTTLIWDPANTRCYSGSGTQARFIRPIFALPPFTGTIQGAPTYSPQGYFTGFQSGRYIGNFNFQISGTGSKTVIAWFRSTSTARQGLMGTRPTGFSQGWVLCFNRNAVGNLCYFHTGASAIDVPAGITTNRWQMATAVYAELTGLVNLYVNDQLVGSQGSFSFISGSNFNGILANEDQDPSTPLIGDLGHCLIYNQALLATDINQIFQATRGRYGV